MEIYTQAPISDVSQYFIPIIIGAIPVIIASYIAVYLKNREKSQYIKILRTNFPIINSYLYAIKKDKDVRIVLSPFYIAVGLFLGIVFELRIFSPLQGTLFIIWIIKYNRDILLDLVTRFDGFTLYFISYSYLYIVSGLIVFVIWGLWYYLLKLINLAAPKIKIINSTNSNFRSFPSLKISSTMAYICKCIFLGAIIGVNVFLYIAFLIVLINYKIIPSDFSLNLDTILGIYTSLEKAVPNLNYFAVLYLLGSLINIFTARVVYQDITRFSDEVKRLFTIFFKDDFPEVSIKTENNEVKGQLKDITNNHLVTVNEKNMIKIVPWDKIEVMEASKKDENLELKIN